MSDFEREENNELEMDEQIASQSLQAVDIEFGQKGEVKRETTASLLNQREWKVRTDTSLLSGRVSAKSVFSSEAW